ncbi:MAG: DUF2075 domain-containing protein, partial [Lentisphaerae bacterium]
MSPRIFPEKCPREISRRNAEYRLFREFSRQLSSDFTVIHSYPWLACDGRGRATHPMREGECDFIIIHPRFGMLALEVKSGTLTYQRKSGNWFREEDHSVIQDPYRQAQRSMHYLVQCLKKKCRVWQKNNIPFAFAVAFPDTEALPSSLPEHVRPEISILHPHLDDLQHRLETIYRCWQRPLDVPLSGSEVDAIVDCLLPEFRLTPSLNFHLEENQTQLVRLTEAQWHVLQACAHNRRLLIKGNSGSGKTLLAVKKARELAEQGQNVLYLCYNAPLASMVRERLLPNHTAIDIYTFHQLCRKIVCDAQFAFDPPPPAAGEAALREFYDVTCAELLLNALEKSRQRYDAVIVDEGQD